MTRRYVAGPPLATPRARFDGALWGEKNTTGDVVIVDDAAVFSGLYDAEGRPLYHGSVCIPLGFDLTKRKD